MDGNKMETEGSSKGTDSEEMDTGGSMDGPPNKKVIEEGKYDWNETIEPHTRIAVIGKSGCGKSSLILAVKNQIFPHPDEKLVSKRHPLEIQVDGEEEKCMVSEIDDWDKNKVRREKLYPETNVVLLCFNETWTMELEKKWVSELQEHKVPVILVKIVKELGKRRVYLGRTELKGLPPFMECWPHARKGVQEVFHEAVRTARENEAVRTARENEAVRKARENEAVRKALENEAVGKARENRKKV